MQCMWNVKEKLIPVIISATGRLSPSCKKYLKNIPSKHSNIELQETAIMRMHTSLRC